VIPMCLVLATGLLAVVGCAAAPSHPSAQPSAGLVSLPTLNVAGGPEAACAGVGVNAVLHGSATDPAVTWIMDPELNLRHDAVWPTGYHARFTPALEVLDKSGSIVASEGTAILGVCDVLADNRVFLQPPFR